MDRNGSFEPQIVKKGQTILTPELDDKIIALYGLGMSYRDIVTHMEEMYGIEISKSLITSITDKIIPKIKEWQNRPLESVYPIIFLDAIHFNPDPSLEPFRISLSRARQGWFVSNEAECISDT